MTLVWGSGVATTSGAATDKDQTYPFKVRPEFSAEFNCERENAEAACLPISPMSLEFSAEVPWSEASQISLHAPDGSVWKPFLAKGQSREGDEGVRNITFKGPFPEKTHFEVSLPHRFKDDAERSLVNASRFPLAVSTADFPPLIKFPADFGILELKPEAVLPVTVRNVEPDLKAREGSIQGLSLHMDGSKFGHVIDWMKKITAFDREKSLLAGLVKSSDFQVDPLSLKKPNGDRPFEVMGIPIQKPGFYIVEFESPRLGASLLGKSAPMFVPAAALVTNLSVHFKQGRESSLVWVTTLDQATPVGGATVSVRDCRGDSLATGKTNAEGIATISKGFSQQEGRSCGKKNDYSQYTRGLFIVAQKDDDFSFVHTSWQKGIESWRFDLPSGYTLSSEYASTVFDRTLFRAGETVHMKHFFRKHSMAGVVSADANTLPKAVQIRHQESNQTYEVPLTWRSGSVAETTWSVPKSAKLGVYTVTLLADSEGHPRARHARSTGDSSWSSGEFRVEEYRVPLMKGELNPPSTDLVLPKEVPFDLSVQYLAGGGATKLPVQIRHQTSSSEPIQFPEFEGYIFGTGRVKDPNSAEASLAPGEVELDMNAPTPTATSGPEGTDMSVKQGLVLSQAGTGHVDIPVSSKHQDQIKHLHVELDYRDPNGETQTVGRTVSLYPSARLVGLKPESSYATKDSLKFQVAVTDVHGKAIRHAPVSVEFFEQKTYSHRKRLVGGLYSYESKTELKPQGKACSGTTDEKGLLECDSKPPVSGNLILEAKTTDDAGHDAYSTSSIWVYDNDEWWFSQEDSDRIDLLPEHKHYETGDKAVFQVRMPFREATALVTVEREGVLDSFVVHLSGKKPLIEVPIKPQYAPNVFVSALVVRGRVGDVQPTALVDLGRPAYKLGIGEINVGWKPHELNVRVTPSKNIYQIREKGSFKIQVKTADGSSLPKGSEIALAAVDEGLLELKPNNSWKLLDAMMSRRGYEVETYTAQSEVVGKRHFGLKALSSGGDGGKSPSREIFDSLLYWNGNITLDENGEAQVQFPMNDSTTGFKIAAVAHSGASLFGTGYASIQTTQDLMILSGIPPLAREGDHLPLEFTLRNTTAAAMNVSVSGHAEGLADWTAQLVAIAPHDSKQVVWSVDVPTGVDSLKYEVSARDQLSKSSDRILITQKVIAAVPVRIFQATLAQVDHQYTLPVEKPVDAIAGKGGIRVTLDPTILTGLDGVREYMAAYPFTCLEQRISKAISLRDKKQWQSVIDDLPSYLDSDGLAKYFPADWIRGSDILTAYLISLSNEAGWDFPEDLRSKMLQGLKGFVEGKVTRISDLATSDLTVRKLSALEALSRYGQATWEMTGSLQISPNLWPTSGLIDWADILKNLPSTPEIELKKNEADQILRSRLNFQGTMMTFSSENTDQLWWMMVSTSVNANRLVLSVLSDPSSPGWPSWKDDMGRLVRGALNRQSRGHWDTTTANAWGVLALEKFSQLFEKSKVAGTASVELGTEKNSVNWATETHGKTMDLSWPTTKQSLSITQSGEGKPWATIQSRAAMPLKEPFSSGYAVKKTWSAVEQKTPGKWSKGDIIRVKLEMESQTDMTWVVVNDPIPAGSSILGSGLGNDSAISAGGEKQQGWAEPAFQERAFDGYRAYYQYVPKGKWMTEYTIRLNQSGVMGLPPTRIEAMYAPEMFGEIPNASVSIQ